MDIDQIPIAVTGPGSQPAEKDGTQLEFIALPQDMNRYHAPDIPEPEQVEHLAGARAAAEWIRQALASYRVGGTPQVADISALDAENRELVNQLLGEGEAGIWRTFYLDDSGAIMHDLIEVCDVPVLARRPPDPAALVALSAIEPPADVMNAMPILSEIGDHLRSWRTGDLAHVINLTLLPLSKEDTRFLGDKLGTGPVETLSRGYGDCQIVSTAYPGVWWVRYTNSMGTLILNTLEITDIPMVACAAQEDLDDSRQRFQELLEPYWQELADE